MQTIVDQDDNLEFFSKEIKKKDKQELNDYSYFNDKNQSLQEASFEQFTEKYIQDHIEELSKKKHELLIEQEMKIKEIKLKYSTKLEELDQALQLLTSLQTTSTIKPSKSKQQPNSKLKQPSTNNNNEIMLDLSSINLPFEFTPTDSAKKQDFKLVKTEGNDANLYEPKNSDQYLKMNIQQQLDLGRFTPFVFQPNLKK